MRVKDTGVPDHSPVMTYGQAGEGQGQKKAALRRDDGDDTVRVIVD